MKKNIVIAVLVITNVFSLMYGYAQYGIAKANERKVMEVAETAEMYAVRAAEFQKQAQQAMLAASESMKLAKQQYEKQKVKQ